MKKTITIILTFIAIALNSSAQDKMVIDMPYPGTTVYNGYAIYISDIFRLPADILVKIDSLFSKRLGIFRNKAKFSYGQIVDLDQYFKSNKDISGMQWVVPKYDLFFILTDTTIGIKNYYLHVRLDQYGQILRMNWPMQYYTSAKKFADRNK